LFVALGEAPKRVTTTETVVSTYAATTTITESLTVPVIGPPTMTVNGSLYYADNVTMDISGGNPGYLHFQNTSVTFLGVKFDTYCPPSYGGCPVTTGTTIMAQTSMSIGAIRVNATFPDDSTETMNAVIGDLDYVFLLSRHGNPQTGVLVVYSGGYKAYLLVS